MQSPTKYDFKWYKDDFDTNPTSRGRLFANRSAMEESRSNFEPPIPDLFHSESISIQPVSESMHIDPKVREKWPEFSQMTVPVMLESSEICPPSLPISSPFIVGIILAGEWVPSSGTHNVIVGLVRELFARNSEVTIFGFLGGPQGFARRHYIELTPSNVAKYLNQGGADLLGFGSLRAMELSDYLEIGTLFSEYKLNGLVFVGGPNELSHMSQLIQFSVCRSPEATHPTIIGVFQSPNGNVFVPNDWVSITLGFDSTRTALAEYVGNIAIDGLSSGRSGDVNFVRCGSTAVTMEVALQVCPAYTVLAEEIWEKDLKLDEIVEEIFKVITSRIAAHISSTTILISEKFYASLRGFVQLQQECQELYRTKPTLVVPIDGIKVNPDLLSELSSESRELLARFPSTDQIRIVRAYDANGCPTWPETEPEKLLARLVSSRLPKLVFRAHSIGSEARCPFPTSFDCSLGLALGMTAAHLVRSPGCHGFVASVKNLASNSPTEWKCGGFPLAAILRAPEKSCTGLLTAQFGGASQELINLARQRTEKESLVPRIILRPENLSSDCLFKIFDQCRKSFQLLPIPKQPGPHQFGDKADQSNKLSFAVLSASSREIDIGKNFTSGRSCNPSFLSPNQFARLSYQPGLPQCLVDPHIVDCPVTPHRSPQNLLESVFPRTAATTGVYFDTLTHPVCPASLRLRLGVVFLGRHVPGCHNIVWGLLGESNRVFGFKRGIVGLMNNDYMELSPEILAPYKNQSGIDLLGRTEIPFRKKEEMHACVLTCKKLKLDGLVVVGGIGTHADSAILSELMVASNIPTRVIGIPASVENDIPLIDQTVGHDTACRVYASLIGSLATLAASSKRQWCFVRISGRSGLSQVVAHAAMMTHPNLILLGEEIFQNRLSLGDIVNLISDLISERAKNGHDFGVVVFSETVLENVEEVVRFSDEIFELRKNLGDWESKLRQDLSPMSAALFDALPVRARAHIQHYSGHHEVRLVDPEILLESLVGKELQRRKIFSVVKGSFVSTTHSLSSQGRSSIPSTFDCDLAFTMGTAASHLVRANRSGLLVNVKANENVPVVDWQVEAVPLTSIVFVTDRVTPSGETEYRVEIQRKEFQVEIFRKQLPPPSVRRFVNPGPVQFDEDLSGDRGTIDRLEKVSTTPPIEEIARLCSHIMSLSARASDEKTRRVISSGLKYALEMIGENSANKSPAVSSSPILASLRAQLNTVSSPTASSMRRIGSHGRIIRI